MRLGVVQSNPRVGDLRANLDQLEGLIRSCAGAELVVCPELAVPGYPPRDLLLDDGFVTDTLEATEELARRLLDGPPVLVGTVSRSGRSLPHHPGLHNSAALLQGGVVRALRHKQLLPTYDVFHETRWFVPGQAQDYLDIGGARVSVLLCEDLWDEGYPVRPTESARGADLVVCLSASPFRRGVREMRLEQARRLGAPLLYVNAVGGQDELIFDGGSFLYDGRLRAELPRFATGAWVLDAHRGQPGEPRGPEGEPWNSEGTWSQEETCFEALVLGLQDFVAKNGLNRVVLGLSGGIDSALVACLAREAVGPDRVLAVALPTRFNAPASTDTARELAENLGIGFEVVDLEPMLTAALASLAHLDCPSVRENLQARLRADILLAYLNRHGGLLLNTSNKTELTLGYGTLHGDLAGTLSVLGDLTKPEVYRLANWFQAETGLIPPYILERAPSAELCQDQVDPFDYPALAPRLEDWVQGRGPVPEEHRDAVWRAEAKRRQFGIILKVSERAFGCGRMVPVTARPTRVRPLVMAR